jgi:hypothetical protein
VKRLYLQIYLTVIASLVAFATAAGVLWWLYIDQLAPRHPMEIMRKPRRRCRRRTRRWHSSRTG